MINYNCNENNESYYIDFENELRKIFNKGRYDDVEYIPEVLKNMGYEILIDKCYRYGWSGSVYLFYKKDDKYFIFESAFGSCSFCDVWNNAYESVANFMEVFKSEDRDTVSLNTKDDILKFVNDHYFFDESFKESVMHYIEEL